MRQKQAAIFIMIIGVALAVLVFFMKVQQEEHIDLIVAQSGTCFLEDGTCLHQQGNSLYISGWVISGLLALVGLYLLLDKSQEKLAEVQVRVSHALENAAEKDKEKDEWHAFLKAFNDEEKKVLSAIKEQDGILQSTLRFRTGMSKSTLSLMLKSLEERGFVSRKPDGKTNKVFLRD